MPTSQLNKVRVLSNALSVSQEKLSDARDSLTALEASYTRLDGEYASLSAVNTELGNTNMVLRAQLNTLERKYRASCVRAEELVSHARNLEVFWGHKLKYSLGQFSTAVRAAVAVGSFARLLNTFAETPTAYNLEDPASIDLMIGFKMKPMIGFKIKPIISDHAIMEPFHLAIRHAVLVGAEVTRHLAYTAVRTVPKNGGDAGAEPPASAARVVTTAVVVPAAPTAANAA
ncbi:hypothetical protein HYH02_005551 [Chlamydomonas schloesseri]|uniref:Uncharacterized protein n=1 Tax=Chlamydomonas schloesseri TaxID=2026947 RepID=A0A835WL54_9CHLO|nr:hypothetical protein HYH02_005551 [Chlamydomonas schloesseri]|eukprot:KAG2449402.1 hypothetical protein HYH02_005551 [Chlamydomonas schloesseri]